MSKNASMNQWGHDPIPTSTHVHQKDPIRAYKFMQLNHPVCDDFGGHYSISGSYHGHFYGPDQVAFCPKLEEKKRDPDQFAHVKDHEIPGPPTTMPDGCTCGIYSQLLSHIRDKGDYDSLNSLAQLDLRGPSQNSVRYSKTGFRSSHVSVRKIWTNLPIDNDQLSKAQNDLRIKIERVPFGYSWNELIDNHPELNAQVAKDHATLAGWDRETAMRSTQGAGCPICKSTNLGLVDNSSGNSRDAICHDCNATWKR